MTQLMVHGQKVDTVFELLGNNENAMTYSLGWALAKCDIFRQAVAKLLEIVALQFPVQHRWRSMQTGCTQLLILAPEHRWSC